VKSWEDISVQTVQKSFKKMWHLECNGWNGRWYVVVGWQQGRQHCTCSANNINIRKWPLRWQVSAENQNLLFDASDDEAD